MKILRIRMKGFTASFRLPFAISGVQLSLPVPSYPNILGIISCCMGKNIRPKDTSIGFEFEYESKGQDIERFVRWDYNLGKPILKSKGPAIRKREFLINPSLILYIPNLDLLEDFRFPQGIPTLGRSQDLAWIDNIDQIEITPIESGKIGGTLIPSSKLNGTLINGFIFRLPEYIEYDEERYIRSPKNHQSFIATNSISKIQTDIKLKTGLFTSKSFEDKDKCIYLHEWK